MQGYDAHYLNTDVQVGGTDQLFNIMTASRKIMSYFNQKPNIGIILSILPGTDGVVKMSKSLGNHIPLNSTSDDMYGKVMSVPDIAMLQYAELATRWAPTEIEEFSIGITSGSMHPRDAKMKLAFEIVSAFFSDDEAVKAQDNFVNLFQKGDLPEEIQEHKLEDEKNVLDLMVDTSLVPSKSQGRRLIDQRGVKFDGSIVTDPMMIIDRDGILQVGKRFFLRIRKN
jgi:tyrosyl-tRNA synthetase